MIISIIAAMDENRVIGRGNKMPWRLPVDLKRFRAITMGHPLIMGRKTHESIGAPLPGRKNIVITRQENYQADGCVVVHDIPSALGACGDAGEAFVLGGETIFRDFVPLADRIYLTIVKTTVEGDARFPEIPDVFAEVSRTEARDAFLLVFVVYERKGTKPEGTKNAEQVRNRAGSLLPSRLCSECSGCRSWSCGRPHARAASGSCGDHGPPAKGAWQMNVEKYAR